MEVSILFDIAILVLLLVFAIRGASRGLVLSLCSLVAVVLAFVGGTLVADAAAPMVSKALEPKFAAAIEARLEAQMQDASWDPGAQVPEGETDIPLQAVLRVLKDMGLYEDLVGTIEAAVDAGMTEVAAGAAAAVAAAVARSVAYAVLFVATFIVILILWSIISHALDLVTRLPGLNTLNRTGGALFGLIKCCILLFLCAWVLRYSGNLIPEETVAQTRLLQFFLHTNPFALVLGQ